MNELDRISQDVTESLESDSRAPLLRGPVLADMKWMVTRNLRGESLIREWNGVILERNKRISTFQRQLRNAEKRNENHATTIASLTARIEFLAKERNAAAEILTEVHAMLDTLGVARSDTLLGRIATLAT